MTADEWQTAARALTFTVNSLADTDDAVINGTCDDGTGVCTLRAAIEEANALAGHDEIVVAAGETRCEYPVFLPEWMETTRTSRFIVNGSVEVTDPRGRRRTLLERCPRRAVARSARLDPVAQRLQLTAEADGILPELEHRLVLLGDVPLQVGDLLLKELDSFAQRRERSRP